jgi:S1-C subfamily serine protease
MRIENLVAMCSLLLLGACEATMNVYSVADPDEVFTGTATGNGHHSTITINNGKGKSCIGQTTGSPSTGGYGLLTCNDGERAQIQYTVLTFFSGYGFGTTNNGRNVRFTYGLSREEAEKYIGQSNQASSGAGGGQQPPNTRGSGSGFFITRQGHVVTNAHVVDGCKALTVAQAGGSPMSATAVATDKQNDLAILQTASPSASIAALRGGRPVRPGETVVAYGFPLTGRLSSGGALTTGTVNALAGLRDDTRYFQISAPIQPGNSGGPLMDTTGAVIGITTSTISTNKAAQAIPQNVNFAIKADVVRTFLASSGISAETSTGGRELSPPDIGERARAFTVLIECKG